MQKEERPAPKVRAVPTALDALGAWETHDAAPVGWRSPLPEGVESKQLYIDVARLAWPALVELLLVQLASLVDLAMVGTLGPWAITAVGLATQPKYLMATMFIALNVGVTAMVARARGARDRERAQLLLRQGLLIIFAVTAVCSAIGYVFSEQFIWLMGAQEEATLVGGTQYLQIQMLGLLFVGITATFTAALRGSGNSRAAMVYNLLGNLVNVAFNYFLITGQCGFPRLEVAGASIATIIGQFVSFLVALGVVLRKEEYVHLDFRRGFKPDRQALGAIWQIGAPAMLEQFISRVGFMVFARLVAGLGTLAYATHQICVNIQAMCFMNGQAFAVASTSMMGQSLGKNRTDMGHAYARRTQVLGVLVALIIASLCFFCGGPLVSLFNKDPYIVENGARLLRIVALIQPLHASQFILAGALRGAGDTRFVAIISFVTILVVRPVLAAVMIFGFDMGLTGAWLALATDQLLRATLTIWRYRSAKWKQIRIQ
ncbi:MAG TPA: MATE family efflux transporter [Oscillospiraceae bacterium]|nr:MATE family efflux transporter [Oscillospiraceae bacterium]